MLTAEQHAIRRTGIGASDIGAILGADGAFDSSLSIWAQKVGMRQPIPDNEVPEYVRLGNLLEPVIAQLYVERNPGVQLYERGTIVNPRDGLQIATPDRLVRGEAVGLQIKKARTKARWGTAGTDEVPENILCQTQWEMSVADLEREEVPVLFWGSKLEIFRVERDDDLIGCMVDLGHKWWRDHVVTEKPPTPDGHERTRETLGQIFAKTVGRMAPSVPVGAYDLAVRYKEAGVRAKADEAEKEALGNQLRLLVGAYDGFEAEWGKVLWRKNEGGPIAWKEIAETLKPSAELIAQHTGEPKRPLKVYLKKGYDDV